MGKKICEAAKYRGKWAVYLIGPNTFEFIGKEKKFCEKKADELNNGK